MPTTMVTPRFTSRSIAASERPRDRYEYYVTGSGEFPTDMLRYDACWPASTDDALNLTETKRRSIRLFSYTEPTVARWSSFLWAVGTQKL